MKERIKEIAREINGCVSDIEVKSWDNTFDQACDKIRELTNNLYELAEKDKQKDETEKLAEIPDGWDVVKEIWEFVKKSNRKIHNDRDSFSSCCTDEEWAKLEGHLQENREIGKFVIQKFQDAGIEVE